MSIVPEEIDLFALTGKLRERFGDIGPAGYIPGKTELRAAIVFILQCSELEGEQLVDTLETRGMIHYRGDKRGRIDDLENFWEWG